MSPEEFGAAAFHTWALKRARLRCGQKAPRLGRTVRVCKDHGLPMPEVPEGEMNSPTLSPHSPLNLSRYRGRTEGSDIRRP